MRLYAIVDAIGDAHERHAQAELGAVFERTSRLVMPRYRLGHATRDLPGVEDVTREYGVIEAEQLSFVDECSIGLCQHFGLELLIVEPADLQQEQLAHVVQQAA